MMTLEEIKNVSFRKANIGGYRVDDVDDFIDKVEEMFGTMGQENRAGLQKIQELTAKLTESKAREDSIGQVLLNAQRQADSVVREAGQKAQIILEDAQNEAQEMIFHAQEEIDGQKEAIETLKKEVAQFKAKLLSVYREHLTLIDALPGGEEEPAEAPAAAEAKAEEPAAPEVPAAPVQPQAPVATDISSAAAPAPTAIEATVDFDQFADEILAETAPAAPKRTASAQPETAPAVSAAVSQPRRAVSLFDEDYESGFTPTDSHFETLKFGDDYDLKDDPDMVSGSRRKR